MNPIHLASLYELFGQALLAIRDNRLRTLLSVVGIMLGIAAVIVVGTIGKGGRMAIYKELETFGLRSVWVSRDWRNADPRRVLRRGTGISTDDYLSILDGCCPYVTQVSPIVRSRKQPRIRVGEKYSRANIYGVNEFYLDINNDDVSSGRSLRTMDISRGRFVAVIGKEVQDDLFGENIDAIGRDIRIGKYKFTIIGVLNPKSRDFLASIGSIGGQNANERILIPYNIYQRILGREKIINTIQAEANRLEHSDAAKSQIIDTLIRRNSGRYKYKGQTMTKWVDTANNILQGVSWIGIVAASVSLIVGGIGIMNIMSTSVVERTREIGIRKAVGARRQDILFQFLMESVVISAIGGLLGLILGILASSVLAIITGFPLTPSTGIVIIALLVSAGVGLASGYYPAQRASLMQPVTALRYE